MRTLGLSRNRLVTTAMFGTESGWLLSTKLVLASPPPKEALNCNAVGFSNCFFDPFTPGYAIGFKQWDIAVQKEWNSFAETKFRLRADLLNVMNWRNFTDYDTWRGGPGAGFNANFGRRNGDGTSYPPRLLKVTAGLSW
jgi:hypothetical protein